jgi:hypothetical protein
MAYSTIASINDFSADTEKLYKVIASYKEPCHYEPILKYIELYCKDRFIDVQIRTHMMLIYIERLIKQVNKRNLEVLRQVDRIRVDGCFPMSCYSCILNDHKLTDRKCYKEEGYSRVVLSKLAAKKWLGRHKNLKEDTND